MANPNDPFTPSSTPPTSSGGGGGSGWLIALVVIILAIVAYYVFGRSGGEHAPVPQAVRRIPSDPPPHRVCVRGLHQPVDLAAITTLRVHHPSPH